jgi:NAD(P)-dependent dehydrogenase (short-subunit alcohol dehydrogenase family)
MTSVLITGTSRGIGFQPSLFFALAGNTNFATMRNPQAFESSMEYFQAKC